jgi:hypothetical protein
VISLLVVAAAQLRPKHAVNLTLFHVNPANYTSEPINMDTGNALGDMFFDLRSIALPLECKDDPSQNDCKNSEVVSPNLVITKIIVEVDQRFTGYAKCNICVNGTDSHGHNNCTDGDYICACGDPGKLVPCGPGVGMENISERFTDYGCNSSSREWQCWKGAVAQKTGGLWFSTLDVGHCGNPNSKACMWRLVNVEKRIAKSCSDNSIYSAAEDYDHEQGTGCFAKCPQHSSGRNTSDTCWVKCFYETTLGPDAGSPGGAVAGMPIQRLLDAWNTPFDSEDAKIGGCPHIPDDRDPGHAAEKMFVV